MTAPMTAPMTPLWLALLLVASCAALRSPTVRYGGTLLHRIIRAAAAAGGAGNDDRGGVPEDLLLRGLARYLDRAQRPPAIGVPRTRMDLPFAVCLMRSSYSAVDELDFVPMDIFQKSFFLFRQDEWQGYKDEHPLSMQGDLSDPVYFDFISFAQYRTIAAFLRSPKRDFVERINADAESIYVRRNRLLDNDDILPEVFEHLVGSKIIDYVFGKYPQSLLPNNRTGLVSRDAGGAAYISDSNFDTIVSFTQLLLDVFEINAFAIDIRATKSTNGRGQADRRMVVTLTAPANLWSLSYLRSRGEVVTNNFVLMALRYYFRACHGLRLEMTDAVVYDRIRCLFEFRISPFDFSTSPREADGAIERYRTL